MIEMNTLQTLYTFFSTNFTTEQLKMAYLMSGFLIVVMYVPQIIKLLNDNTGAYSISLTSWASWAALRLPAFIYALVILNDFIMLSITLGDIIGRITVFGVAAYKKFMFVREHKHIEVVGGNTTH